jgi:hypothetical protein
MSHNDIDIARLGESRTLIICDDDDHGEEGYFDPNTAHPERGDHGGDRIGIQHNGWITFDKEQVRQAMTEAGLNAIPANSRIEDVSTLYESNSLSPQGRTIRLY